MKQTINERVKLLRTYLNQTQQEFSSLVGLTNTQLSRIENGEGTPQRGTIQQIIDNTGVDKDWFIEGKGALKIVAVSHKSQTDNAPWKEEAYQSLKETNAYLQSVINRLLDRGSDLGKSNPSVYAGLLNKRNSRTEVGV